MSPDPVIRTVVLATALLCTPAAFAAPVVLVGYISWDVTLLGSAGQFDITNLTGPNATPALFLITTTVNLSDINLAVLFSDGSTTTYGPSSHYFSLAADGESFNGSVIPIGGTNPQPTSATLTGTFNPLSIEDPNLDMILSTFTAVLLDTPNLVDGDFAVINAIEALTSTTPLPSTWTMLIAAFIGLGFFAYRGTKKRSTGIAAA